MEKRHPLLRTLRRSATGRELVDGAFRGIGMPKSTPPLCASALSDLWAALNNDPR